MASDGWVAFLVKDMKAVLVAVVFKALVLHILTPLDEAPTLVNKG